MSSVEGERQQVRQAMITGVRWLASARLLAQTSSWIITLIVIRLLTPDDYGLQAMVAAVYTLLLLLSQAGFDRAIASRADFSTDELRKTLGFTLALNVAVMIAIWVLAPLIAGYYNEPRVTPILRLMATGFVINVFKSIPTGIVWRQLDYRTHAVANLLQTVSASLITLAMAIMGFGVWALIIGMLVSPAFSAAYLQLRIRWLVMPRFGGARIGDLVRYAYTISLGFFVWMFAWRVDILIGGQRLSTVDLGFYAVAINLCALPLNKILPLANELLYPAYARLQGDDVAVHVYFQKALASLSLLLFPLFFGIAAIAPWVVPVVFGNRWSGIEHVMMIVALAMPFRVVLAMCNPLLQATGRAVTAVSTGAFAIVVIATSVAIGVQWGVIGLSFAALVATPVVMGVVIWRTRQTSGISLRELAESIGPPLAISAIMAIIVYYIGTVLAVRLPDVAVLGLQIFSGMIVYAALGVVFSRGLFLSTFSIVRTSLSQRGKKFVND